MPCILSEPEVHDLIRFNKIVQDGIKNALGIEENISFIHEDRYINGISADFSLVNEETKVLKGIIECKSGNINVTDYIRGIGQLLQYEYFSEEKIPHKSLEYENPFKTIYFYPSSVIKNNQFNIAKFKYPNTTSIYELNEVNYAVREISEEELNKLGSSYDDNLITISQYYFRDNRIFEYYILMKYLYHQETIGISNIKRSNVEDNLTKIETINNKNWRNAFITLSKLGFINKNNLLSEAGKQLVILEYETFAVQMYHTYLEPYFSEIQKCFNGESEINLTNKDIVEEIRKNHGNRDVLYLTESEARYVSSWLNIMRDDYGILNFEPGKKLRKINYNPSELNDRTLKEKIKENSIAYKYINKFQNILRG